MAKGKLTRESIKQMGDAEYEQRRDEIKEWIRKGQPEPDQRRRPDGYKFSRAEIARMDDEEVAINASSIRDAIASGNLI